MSLLNDVTCSVHTTIYAEHFIFVVSGGAVRSVASSYAAMRMVAGSRPVLVIA